MAKSESGNQWMVEVARGREPGRRLPLGGGETTIGNAPGGPGHLSLADQEGASPRRMTGKQAVLIVSGGSLAIRDLDGPGGTFVNHQRLLSGVDRPLSPGDEIQLGGVRLVVRRESGAAARSAPSPSPPPPPPSAVVRSGPMAAACAFPGGLVCRTWDDFLALAAQRWILVRDELTSGRLAEHLRRVGRTDLLPRKEAGWSADDALDDWLGRLPTTRPSAPELDVHPNALIIRAGASGGTVRRTIRIANVGYRLLRSTVRVESSGVGRTRLAGGVREGESFATIDQSDVELELDLPEGGAEASLGAVVVESNGGARRVEIRLERARVETIPVAADESAAGLLPVDLSAVVSPSRRFWLFPLILVGAHGLVGGAEPRLATLAAVGSALGFVVGTALGARGGGATASGFAGAAGGLLASALAFAMVRSVDGLIGPSLATGPAAVVAWALIGVGLALASWIAFPARGEEGA